MKIDKLIEEVNQSNLSEPAKTMLVGLLDFFRRSPEEFRRIKEMLVIEGDLAEYETDLADAVLEKSFDKLLSKATPKSE